MRRLRGRWLSTPPPANWNHLCRESSPFIGRVEICSHIPDWMDGTKGIYHGLMYSTPFTTICITKCIISGSRKGKSANGDWVPSQLIAHLIRVANWVVSDILLEELTGRRRLHAMEMQSSDRLDEVVTRLSRAFPRFSTMSRALTNLFLPPSSIYSRV